MSTPARPLQPLFSALGLRVRRAVAAPWAVGLAFFAAGLGIALLSLSVGSSGWRWALGGELEPWIFQLRAPRVVLSALIGASLATAGVAMQTLLENELADPYVLGLSGGASAGAVLSLALIPAMPPGLSAAVGAAGAAVLVRGLARGPYDASRLLLAGIAVSAVLGSVTALVLVLAPEGRVLRSAIFWLFGGLGAPRPIALVVPAVLLGVSMSWFVGRAERLDRLSLGSDVASTLGVDVRPLRRGVLIVAVLLTAASVAAAGLVGFIGLVAPHAARRLVGASHRRLVPVAAWGGAVLLMIADGLARTAFAPREVPLGLLTALVGGPFFLWQLARARAERGLA